MRGFPWREVLAGLAVTGAATSLGAAVNVRDRTSDNEHEIRRISDVQAEKNDRILADLKAIKTKLGIPQ